MRDRPLASMGALIAVALACATPAVGQGTTPASVAHPLSAHKPAPKVRAKSPIQKAAAPVKPAAKAHAKPVVRGPVAKPLKTALKKAVKPAPPTGVLVLAGCYGRFIGWRDELSGLMLQSNSYTPWPLDRVRFDRIENALAAGAKRDRNLVLTLQPTFKEADFPADVRAAFRTGLKTTTDRFAEAGYRHTQLEVLSQPDLTPAARMSQLEANADQVFAPMAAACERQAAR